MDKQVKKSPNEDFSQRLSFVVETMFEGSQRALALRSGLSPQAINTYLNPPNGVTRIPKSYELYRLAVACGMTMEELLTGQKPASGGESNVAGWRDRALAAEQKLALVKAGLSAMIKKI